MSRSEQYRVRAEEALLCARTAATPERQEAWRKIAQAYCALADQTDGDHSILSPVSRTNRLFVYPNYDA